MRIRSTALFPVVVSAAACSTAPAPADVTATDAAFDTSVNIPDVSPPDALSSDATVADAQVAPVELRLPGTLGTLVFSAPMARVALLAPDGSTVASSPTATPFLEVATRRGGIDPARAPDLRPTVGTQLAWHSLSRVRSVDRAANLVVLTDDATGDVDVRAVAQPDGHWTLEVTSHGADVVALRFRLASDDGAYHGLGERHGPLDARGTIVPMQLEVGGTDSSTNEIHVPVPFVVDSRGYGMFVETREPGIFDVAKTDPGEVRAAFEGTHATVHLFRDDPLAVIAAYTRVTGLPRLPPRWAFGPMVWRNVWNSREELLGDANRYRSEGIPTTTMWIDNPWQASYSDSTFDESRFTDPASMMQEMARLGYKVIFWSVPYLDATAPVSGPTNAAQRLFAEARDRNLLVRNGNGSVFVSPDGFVQNPGMSGVHCALLDFTSSDAVDFWAGTLSGIIGLGARGFKLDYGEDLLVQIAGARPSFQFSNGETTRTVHSTYPIAHHTAYRTALDRLAPGDGVIIGRASSWGGQRVVDVIWPGDLDSDFGTDTDATGAQTHVGGLPSAINSMVSLAESGFPAFGSDTGGYKHGPPVREVLLRWAEQTALSPILQLGGGGESHNPWQYDDAATAVYRGLAQLHQDLVPYLRVQAIRASADGTPAVRSLSLAFPDDRATRSDPYAYELGPDLIVYPVVTAGATMRAVHIPAGTWVHWFDRTVVTGPADVQVPVPIGRPALYVRQGAVIPLEPADVVTLATTSDPGAVDESDRASITRAAIVPGASAAVTLEDGARITAVASTGADGTVITFAPGRTVTELRATIDVTHGTVPAPVTSVAFDGTVVPMSADLAAVPACDSCWFRDSTTGIVTVGVRGARRVNLH